MDLQTPRMDEASATRAIRSPAGKAAANPIIALTADVLPDQVGFHRASSMDDHLGKPIDPREPPLKTALWGEGQLEPDGA